MNVVDRIKNFAFGSETAEKIERNSIVFQIGHGTSPFTSEDIQTVVDEVGTDSKFIIVGTNTEPTELHNTSYIIFFRSIRGLAHDSVLRGIIEANPQLVLKDAGFYDFIVQDNPYIYGRSLSLNMSFDKSNVATYRFWLSINGIRADIEDF